MPRRAHRQKATEESLQTYLIWRAASRFAARLACLRAAPSDSASPKDIRPSMRSQDVSGVDEEAGDARGERGSTLSVAATDHRDAHFEQPEDDIVRRRLCLLTFIRLSCRHGVERR